MSNDNMKAKTHNNECLLFAVIFLSMLIVLAIVCVAVMVASVSGVIFSSVLCIALTVLTVVSVAIIYSQYK